MLRWLCLFYFLPSVLFGAEPWSPARDYWAPEDPEGFLQPLLTPEPPASSSDADNQLQVLALNEKAFVHRTRRRAEALGTDPLLLQETARIYSPSQSYAALQKGKEALLILHPQTSMDVRRQDGAWQFQLTGERGLIRMSTHAQGLSILLKPADPQTPWDQHDLDIRPGTDLYLKYDRSKLQLFVIRGRVLYRMAADLPLQAERPDGLLRNWEARQWRHQPKSPHEIDVYAGQELRLKAGPILQFQIALPHSETWQSALMRTSPQLAEIRDPNNPLQQKLLELRRDWLNIWTAAEKPGKETLSRRLQEGRWEEAFDLLKDQEPDLEHKSMQAICLYRLQQEKFADKKLGEIDPTSFWFDIVKQESLRARLRRKARRELSPPADLPHARIPVEELYLLASNEQARGRWRSALDLWERWPETAADPLQESHAEWQRHLDQKKPWSFFSLTTLGWSDNVLHLPSGLAAPAEIGHRSSWWLRSSLKLPYRIERSAGFRVELEPSFHFMVYQHSGLAELQRSEPGLALPLRIQLPWEGQSLGLKPYVSRLMQGSGGLDRFGYELAWKLPVWGGSPEFSWSQEQNLDFAPTVDHRLDALTGERVGALDRSVRRQVLAMRMPRWELELQDWDYRYVGSEADDRQRILLRGHWQRDFPYDLQFRTQGSLHQDIFAKGSAAVTGIDLQLQVLLRRWVRLEPMFSIERDMRQSGDKARSFSENRYYTGLHYRW